MSLMIKHGKTLPANLKGVSASVPWTSDMLEDCIYVVVEGNVACKDFKKLIQQGSCLEPNLSAEMKELADLVTTGSIQQPYREMPK